MGLARVRQEGEIVLLGINGQEVRLPASVAIGLGKELIAKGKLAEEIAEREGIILDHAILLRKGIPLGLTNHPYLQKEVAREAVGNSRLRRYLPGGVKSEEMVGTPAVIVHPPRN